MITLRIALAIAALFVGSLSHAADGLLTQPSPLSVKATADKFETLVQQAGLKVFLRIDHAAGAATVGKTLAPTELIIFGSPKAGTALMECQQTLGIDLPLKALIWQDAAAQVWIGYNDPAYLADRHAATNCPAVDALGATLRSLVSATVNP